MDAVLRSEQKKIALISSQVGARRGSRRSLGKYGRLEGGTQRSLPCRSSRTGGRPAASRWSSIRAGCVPTWAGSAASLSVEESARGIRQVMADLDESRHGRFWTWDGREHPW